MWRTFSIPIALFMASNLPAQTSAQTPDKMKRTQPALCTVSGRVLTATERRPLKSARVVLMPINRDSTPDDVLSDVSDADGQFTLKQVPPGRYEFFATHSGFVRQSYQSQGTGDGAVLALAPGQEVTGVLFRLIPAAVITGRVNDEDGEPLASILVLALRRPQEDELDEYPTRTELVPAAVSQTDDRGQYRLFGLSPGDYYIQATDSVEPPQGISANSEYWAHQAMGAEYLPIYYPGTPQRDQAQSVSLKAGEEIEADLSMIKAITVEISGHVIGPDGAAATKANVSLEQPGVDDFGMSPSAFTDDRGAFRLKGIVPGNYTVIASQREEEGRRYHAQKRIQVGGRNIDSVTLALGRGATIHGRLTLADSEHVNLERVSVRLSPPQGGDFSVFSHVKKDGSFEFTDVEDGNYALRMNVPGHQLFMKSAHLGAVDVLEQGVEVDKTSARGTLDVVLASSSAQLDGVVTQNEKPVVGSRVGIVPDPETPYNHYRIRTALTDQAGRFLIRWHCARKISREREARARIDRLDPSFGFQISFDFPALP